MAYADLHIHSNFSLDGTCNIETIIKYTAAKTNLDIIAITDHNEIKGSLLAKEIAPAYGLQVVTGSEISTSDGHLLGLFISEKIPARMSARKTIIAIREMGGLCIVPHPGAKYTHSISLDQIHALLQDETISETLVGMEIFNAGVLRNNSNQLAARFALEHDISLVASSDAHVPRSIGKGATGFRGASIEDLKMALINHKTYTLQQKRMRFWNIAMDWISYRYLPHSSEV